MSNLPQSGNMAVGWELPPITTEEITHTQLVKYAGASGDFNPIHTVVPVAEQAGLGGVIAHGMLIMGIAGRAIADWFPRRDLRQFKVRFAAMTKPGETITIRGKVIDRLEVHEEVRLKCKVTAENQNGDIKLQGEFQVAVQE